MPASTSLSATWLSACSVIAVAAHARTAACARALTARLHVLTTRRNESGQASAEYALVLLGCAAVALLITAWATKTNKVGKLLDTVMDTVMDKVKP